LLLQEFGQMIGTIAKGNHYSPATAWRVTGSSGCENLGHLLVEIMSSAKLAVVAVVLALSFTGCQTPHANPVFLALEAVKAAATNAPKSDVMVLREGDSVRISFPGAPNLNTIAPIRRDGMITLQLIGEFKAAGLTPSQLEKELIKLYGPQLQTKEVSVAVESSAFPVYVTGAVLRPGKIMSDRPIAVLEAIMEAGGFDYTKANLKAVTVIRYENGKTEHRKLNLKPVLQGQGTEQFNLKPFDIIYVPERFNWF
jgi:polysaccharide biosynthesis/export protein